MLSKAEPVVAVHFVGLPLRAVGEVAARVARPVAQARMNRCLVLGLEGVDFGAQGSRGARQRGRGRGGCRRCGERRPGSKPRPADVARRAASEVSLGRPERRRERDAERRYGWRRSSMPIPVSISTSESAVSTSRQWQTIRAPVQPPSPLTSLPPYGHIVPQLRWWIFAAIGAILAQIGHGVCTRAGHQLRAVGRDHAPAAARDRRDPGKPRQPRHREQPAVRRDAGARADRGHGRVLACGYAARRRCRW